MAEESLVTILGFDAQQAITTLKQLELQLGKYNKAMRTAASVTSKYNKATSNIANEMKKGEAVVRGFSSGVKKQSTALQSAEKQMQKATNANKRLSEQSKKTSKQMILSWQSVIRIFTIQVIHQMISKTTSALSEATKKAMDLEISLAEIQTIGGPLRNDFEGLATEVRELSDAFGIQASTVAEGIYQTLSNQVARATESFTFFATAADFSIAAVTGADASINLLSSTINAFGFNASEATLIGAKLFKTIELGRIRGEEFANTFGRVAVLASRLGISLDEVLASIATLTISGLKYNEAFTLINNVMLKLIRPTEALKNVFQSLGIQTIEAGIQAFGFQGLLAKLAQTTGSSATEMGKLFGRVRAVRGALGLTGEAAKKYEQNLQAIREAGPETLFEAKKLIFETNAKQVQMEIEELRNVIVFDFGRKALNIINKVINAFGGLTNIVTVLGSGISAIGIGFIALATASNPVIAGIVAIGVAVSALTVTWNEFSKTAQERIQERLSAQKRAIIEINAAEAKAAEARISYFRGEFAVLQKSLIDRLAAVNRIKQQAIQTETLISAHLEQQLDDRKSAFKKFVQTMVKNMDQAKNSINKAQGTIFALQQKLSQEIFEGQTAGLDETRKAQAVLQRSTELSRKGAEAFRKGHKDRAGLLFSEATALAEQAKSIGQNTNNLNLEQDARNTLKQIVKDQIGLQKQLVQTEQERSQALSKQIPIESARARRIEAIVEKLKEFKLFDTAGEFIFKDKDEAAAAITPLLNALQTELTAAGYKINIFKNLEETGATNIRDALTKALAPIDDIFTAKKIPLHFAYADRINQVFKDLQDVADKIPIDIKLRLEKLGFDVSTLKGIEDASKGLVEVFQSIERSIRATAGLEGQQEALESEIQAVNDSVNKVTDSFRKQLGVIGTFKEAFKDPLELSRRVWSLDTSINRQRNEANRLLGVQGPIFDKIHAAASRAQEQITGTFDRAQFTGAIEELTEMQVHLAKFGTAEQAQGILFMIEKLKEAGNTAQGISAITKGTEIQFGTEALQKLEDIFTLQKELGQQTTANFQNLGAAATVASTTGTSAFSAMQTSLRSLEQQAGSTARAIAGIAAGAATPARFGRMIYRQYGGGTAQSTDTVPAMLSPGEFVVNARSSRRFYSQLVAMNAGSQPTFRRSGGSSTTIGDINITVDGAKSPKQTAREMVLAIRREKRRHTSQDI